MKRKKEEPLRAAFITERRKEGLDAVLANLANLDRLRSLFAGLEAVTAAAEGKRVSIFLEWEQAELASREAAFSPSGLERRFEVARLCGEDDDLSFKSPYWY